MSSDTPPPLPWQTLEPWRRNALLALCAVVVGAYVARFTVPGADAASRWVVVLAGLVALALWSRRPRV